MFMRKRSLMCWFGISFWRKLGKRRKWKNLLYKEIYEELEDFNTIKKENGHNEVFFSLRVLQR